MSDAAPRLATYEDLFALPQDVRAEVIVGQVVTPPSVLPRHARAAGAIAHLTRGPFDQDSDSSARWWILPKGDVPLDEPDLARPDVTGFCR
ncbi:MAG: hypothetical protein OXU20_30715 [Myxococcales bacterium]|nr:hypothetical protein [Myxococcales bacterium]